MQKSSLTSALRLAVFGVLLAFIKLVYLFFDSSGILDLLVFSTAGFLLSQKVPPGKIIQAALLAFPAFLLCLFFILRLGYSNIVEGVGTSYALSLIFIPTATYFGIWIKHKRSLESY